jgi:nicotinamidase-related amidase
MPNSHGSFPDRTKTALLLIDVINDLNFPEADALLQLALPMAKSLANLKRRARRSGIATIYVNDNFGRWKSDFRRIVEHCVSKQSRGAVISRLLRPKEYDYFVLKPMHSGFYSTTLEVLLKYLEVDTLILTGIATNICVLLTANDAYMRGYHLYVPRDCVAANTVNDNEYALGQMRNLLKADTGESVKIDLDALSSSRSMAPRRRAGAHRAVLIDRKAERR